MRGIVKNRMRRIWAEYDHFVRRHVSMRVDAVAEVEPPGFQFRPDTTGQTHSREFQHKVPPNQRHSTPGR